MVLITIIVHSNIYSFEPDISWVKVYEGRGFIFSVEQTDDGCFIALGYKFNNDEDFWLFKVDSTGEQLWERTFGDSGMEIGRTAGDTARRP